MKLKFPLDDIIPVRVSEVRKPEIPVYANEFWQMNQNEFEMQVEGVGGFYARDGRVVEYSPAPGVTAESVELYLNGSVYGAILHQRKILPLHGSCFLYDNRGIMLCGEAGAGKSSLTASFCYNGAEFLTDDVTPVLFKDDIPFIWALSDRIKLWDDTLKQLEVVNTGLNRIHPETEKYYVPMDASAGYFVRLSTVYILERADGSKAHIEEITGPAKFAVLRNEIYRAEYLEGMPENEPVYFKNLVEISNKVRVFRFMRPLKARVTGMKLLMEEHLLSLGDVGVSGTF